MLLTPDQLRDMLRGVRGEIRGHQEQIRQRQEKLTKAQDLLKHLQSFCTHKDHHGFSTLFWVKPDPKDYGYDECDQCGYVEELPF